MNKQETVADPLPLNYSYFFYFVCSALLFILNSVFTYTVGTEAWFNFLLIPSYLEYKEANAGQISFSSSNNLNTELHLLQQLVED